MAAAYGPTPILHPTLPPPLLPPLPPPRLDCTGLFIQRLAEHPIRGFSSQCERSRVRRSSPDKADPSGTTSVSSGKTLLTAQGEILLFKNICSKLRRHRRCPPPRLFAGIQRKGEGVPGVIVCVHVRMHDVGGVGYSGAARRDQSSGRQSILERLTSSPLGSTRVFFAEKRGIQSSHSIKSDEEENIQAA